MLAPENGGSARAAQPLAELLKTDIVRQALQGACHRPLVPLSLGFIAGVGIASSAVGAIGLFMGAALAFLAAVTLLAWQRSRNSYPAILAGLLLIGFALGAIRSAAVAAAQASNSLTAALGHRGPAAGPQLAVLTGTISSPLHSAARSKWIMLDVTRFAFAPARAAIAASDTPRALILLPPNNRASESELQVGSEIQIEGLLSQAPEARQEPLNAGFSQWLRMQDVSALLVVKQSANSLRVISPPPLNLLTLAPTAADKLRAWCDSRFEAALSPSDAAAAGGILLGERASLSPVQLSEFAAAGCAHLLATAGLHVGILVLVLQSALRWLTAPRKLSAALIICAVWLYALAAGDRAAVARAACVASLYYGAILIERAPDLLSALALCALAMLWSEPQIVYDAGFQLSFCTVAGLVIVMPPLMQGSDTWTSKIRLAWLRRFAHGAVEVEILAIAAAAISAPLVAANFNQVSCLGVFANLAACPLMFLLVPAALASLLIGALWMPAGTAAIHILVQPALHGILAVVAWFAATPGCAVSVATPAAWLIALYYAVLFTGCLMLRPRKTNEGHLPNAVAVGGAAPVSGVASAGSGSVATIR